MSRRSKNDTAFATALVEQLGRHGLKQADLAKTGGVSQAYISRLANSGVPSANWVNTIAANTTASPVERYQLHVAAAQSRGYDVQEYVRLLEAENAELRRQIAERNK